MKWNVGPPPSREMKWNDCYLNCQQWMWNEMKWNYSSERFVKWGEMKWNEVKFMKFSETRLWETTTRFIEFYQKSVLVKLSVFQTYRSFSSSQRPTDRPHRRQESLDTSTSAHIRIIWFEFRQRSVWVTRPHVLHELAIHADHGKYVNLLGLQRHV